MSKYTRGPWNFNTDTKFVEAGEVDICGINFNSFDDSDLANARLIAAAPELLNMLEIAAANCPCTVREKLSGHRSECFAPQFLEVIEKAVGHDFNPLREALDDVYNPKCPSCKVPTKHGEKCPECAADAADFAKDVERSS